MISVVLSDALVGFGSGIVVTWLSRMTWSLLLTSARLRLNTHLSETRERSHASLAARAVAALHDFAAVARERRGLP